MGLGGGEKTERATAKRRRDERRKGNVFMSKEVLILVSLLAAVYTLQILGTFILNTLVSGIDSFWNQAATFSYFSAEGMRQLYASGASMYLMAALIPLLVTGLVAVVITLAQTKGLVSWEKLRPKLSKLSPLKGLKNLFSIRGLVELLKSILKIIVLGYVIYAKYQERFMELPRLMEMEFPQILFYAAEFLADIITSAAVIFAFLAAADYLYQRWQYERDLRMSKQEVKEEYKQLEGDPHIKSKIRQKQREMAAGRMMQNVPEADVVIRNPTHYAVALRYEAGRDRSPVVVAKGTDLTALRIIRVAEENGVICMENKPLARGLYDNVPMDREIPEEFFAPVAEVLAFVYSTSKKDKLPRPRPS
jgi:flagellar biosynthetic protein FlhB